jgi:hAT family C-terminal dimerisation region/Domain of unknown function (DUF4413)
MNLGIQTSRCLCTDVKTRWNSTHRMLESALHYQSTFHSYLMRYPNFEWVPTKEEWVRAEKVSKLLEIFLDAANIFSGNLYPTTNLFIVEVFRVKKVISEAYTSDDIFLNSMSLPMFENFEKYWGEIGVLMLIASVLDPHFKLLSVDFTLKRLYLAEKVGSRIEKMAQTLKSLHDKYLKEYRTSKVTISTSYAVVSNLNPAVRKMVKKYDNFYAYFKSMGVKNPPKYDLGVYLGELIYVVEDDSSFDVLKWWRQNCSKYPVLSKLARDVLCIPITTVTSELAFSAGGRVLDDYRSSLKKDVVEILICEGD